MPGNIRVSVLEAIDLPAEVSGSKYVSVKVSVGKREFQTKPSMATDGKTAPWNSDFSFPVLNFRDHLVVMLLDSKGDQVSRNEIETPSIVERGFQDEFLTLKGGGQIHLKLNFVLTDEEKQRIDLMRAAASKRKHKDFQKNGSNQAVQPAAGNEKSSSYMSATAVAGIRPEEKPKSKEVAAQISLDAVEKKMAQQVVMDAMKETRKEISLGLESLKEAHIVASRPDQAQEVVVGSDLPMELQPTALSLPKPLLQQQGKDRALLTSVLVPNNACTPDAYMSSSNAESKRDLIGPTGGISPGFMDLLPSFGVGSITAPDSDASGLMKTPYLSKESQIGVDRIHDVSIDSSVWHLQPLKDGSLSPTPVVGLSHYSPSVRVEAVTSLDTSDRHPTPSSGAMLDHPLLQENSSIGFCSVDSMADKLRGSLEDVATVGPIQAHESVSVSGPPLVSIVQDAVSSVLPITAPIANLGKNRAVPSTPASNLSSGLVVTVAPLVHPVSPEAISLLQLPTLQASRASQTTPNSVKAKIQVFETTFSQNEHMSTPSSRGQSNKLHAKWSAEKIGSVTSKKFEEENSRSLIKAEERQMEAIEALRRPDEKRLTTEEEMRNPDCSIAERRIEQQSNMLKFVEYDKMALGNPENAKRLVEYQTVPEKIVYKQKRDLEERKMISFKSEEVLSSAEVEQGPAVTIDASILGLSNIKNMMSDVILETSPQGSAMVDKSIALSKDNTRSHGSHSSAHLVKKILGAAVMAAAGAFLMWARAGNIKQRRDTVPHVSHQERRRNPDTLSHRAK